MRVPEWQTKDGDQEVRREKPTDPRQPAEWGTSKKQQCDAGKRGEPEEKPDAVTRYIEHNRSLSGQGYRANRAATSDYVMRAAEGYTPTIPQYKAPSCGRSTGAALSEL